MFSGKVIKTECFNFANKLKITKRFLHSLQIGQTLAEVEKKIKLDSSIDRLPSIKSLIQKMNFLKRKYKIIDRTK